MASPAFNRVLLLTCAGPIVWALHFVAIYGFHGLVCARPDWDWRWLGTSVVSAGIIGSGLLALALIAWFCAMAWPRRGAGDNASFLGWTAVGLGGLAAVGVIYETLTIWLVPGCA